MRAAFRTRLRIGAHAIWRLLQAVIVVALALIGLNGDVLLPAPRTFSAQASRWLQIRQVVLPPGQDGQLWLQTAPARPGQNITITLLAGADSHPIQIGRDASFLGLSGVQLTWLPPEDREPEMILAAASGARSVGLDFDWKRIELKQGSFDWSATDDAVRLAKQYGLYLVPMLLNTPDWASSAPYAPLDSQHAPPVDLALFRNFVYEVVNRYKPYGSSPYTSDGYGIRDWVIWNEPNVMPAGKPPLPAGFWFGSLESYIVLLRAGFEGAHAADPGCNVLNGGLADVYWAGGQADLTTAVERLYDPNGDGNAGDGGRPFFDTLNVHIYAPVPPDAQWYRQRMTALVGVMKRFGDADKPIWITETGFGSTSEVQPAGEVISGATVWLSEAQQAQAVELVYQTLAAFPQVQRVFWWSLRDYFTWQSAADNAAMEAHYGLLKADFRPKMAYLAYARQASGLQVRYTTTVTVGEDGQALIVIPSQVVAQPGRYVFLAAPDSLANPTVVSAVTLVVKP